jgi:hypothetical protein
VPMPRKAVRPQATSSLDLCRWLLQTPEAAGCGHVFNLCGLREGQMTDKRVCLPFRKSRCVIPPSKPRYITTPTSARTTWPLISGGNMANRRLSCHNPSLQ